MKKIAYITHHAPMPSRRADPVCVMNTCQSLARLGYQIDLIIPDNQGDASLLEPGESIFSFYDVEENFKIHYLPAKFIYRLGFLGRFIYKLFSLLFGISLNPDIIYCRHLEIALLSTILNQRTIYAAHGVELLSSDRFFPFWVKLVQRRKYQVMMISVTKNAKILLTSKGFPPDRVFVAPNGVNLDKYNLDIQVNLLKDLLTGLNYMKVVLFSGSLYPGRGIEELIESATYHPTLRFAIIGGSPKEIHQYDKKIKQSNISNITFLGYQRSTCLPALICGADILVMPYTSATETKNDMSPMKMFDYMASGRPIVTTDFPVLHEILSDKRDAIFVDPDSGKTIAKGIQWCLDHPAEANRIGKNAKALSRKYTWDCRAEVISQGIKDAFNSR